MPVQREKPGMLARTLVMALTGRRFGADQRDIRGPVQRIMRATAEIGISQIKRRKPVSHPLGMRRRPFMRGAGQRQMFGGQRMGVRRTAGDQRQRLDHLGRGPRQHDLGRVAPGRLDVTRGVADHGMAQMHAFGPRAAPDFGQGNGLGHAGFSGSDHGDSCAQPRRSRLSFDGCFGLSSQRRSVAGRSTKEFRKGMQATRRY